MVFGSYSNSDFPQNVLGKLVRFFEYLIQWASILQTRSYKLLLTRSLKSAKLKTEENILNLVLQNCQKQTAPLESTAQ